MLLRNNSLFFFEGSELSGQTPVTIPLLRQYLCDDYPSIAEKAKLVKEKLDGAMLGTLRDIRSAGEKTWAGVTPPTIGEALGKIFTQQGRRYCCATKERFAQSPQTIESQAPKLTRCAKGIELWIALNTYLGESQGNRAKPPSLHPI